MGRLERQKRQLIEEANKRNLNLIGEDTTEIEDIDSVEQEIDSIIDPEEIETEIDSIEDELPIEEPLEDEIEDNDDPDWADPVNILFQGIETGNVGQVDTGLEQIDMPLEKESAIMEFVKFIGADSYDLHRVADKLDLEQ